MRDLNTLKALYKWHWPERGGGGLECRLCREAAASRSPRPHAGPARGRGAPQRDGTRDQPSFGEPSRPQPLRSAPGKAQSDGQPHGAQSGRRCGGARQSQCARSHTHKRMGNSAERGHAAKKKHRTAATPGQECVVRPDTTGGCPEAEMGKTENRRPPVHPDLRRAPAGE